MKSLVDGLVGVIGAVITLFVIVLAVVMAALPWVLIALIFKWVLSW